MCSRYCTLANVVADIIGSGSVTVVVAVIVCVDVPVVNMSPVVHDDVIIVCLVAAPIINCCFSYLSC